MIFFNIIKITKNQDSEEITYRTIYDIENLIFINGLNCTISIFILISVFVHIHTKLSYPNIDSYSLYRTANFVSHKSSTIHSSITS